MLDRNRRKNNIQKVAKIKYAIKWAIPFRIKKAKLSIKKLNIYIIIKCGTNKYFHPK